MLRSNVDTLDPGKQVETRRKKEAKQKNKTQKEFPVALAPSISRDGGRRKPPPAAI